MSRDTSKRIHAAVTELGVATLAQVKAALPELSSRVLTVVVSQMARDGRLVASEERPRTYSPGRKTGEHRALPKNAYTPEQAAVIERDYLRVGVQALAQQFGRSERSVVERLKKLGLSIPRASKPKPAPRVKVVAPKVKPLLQRRNQVGPAYLPGPPVITDRTRYVVGPRMKQPTHTNTHSML